jgi:phosphosulfolactate phosphohydrolase-like enzyme
MVKPHNRKMNSTKLYNPEIQISFPWEISGSITGVAVVIDVNSASHNISYLLSNASELYVASKENVHLALQEIPDAVLMGESDDISLRDKFISDNDAVSVVNTKVKGKKVILLSYNGTQTLNEVWTKGARPVVSASYPNFHSTIKWLMDRDNSINKIYLVPSGGRENLYSENRNLLEDLLCAQAFKSQLQGIQPDFYSLFSKSILFLNEVTQNNPNKQEEKYKLIFASKDSYNVVPICQKLQNGLLRVTNALL